MRSGITRGRRNALDRSSLSEVEIRSIIDRVKDRVAAAEFAEHTGSALRAGDELAVSDVELVDGIHATIDEAVSAALSAFAIYREMGLEKRKTIVEAVRSAMLREGEHLAYMAAEETGIGRAEDKVVKNRLVTTKTPGPEDLEPHVVTGDGVREHRDLVAVHSDAKPLAVRITILHKTQKKCAVVAPVSEVVDVPLHHVAIGSRHGSMLPSCQEFARTVF